MATTYDPLDKSDQLDASQPSQPEKVPYVVLKQKRAVWLYFIAVGALAVVVVVIPLVSVWGNAVPDQLWTGWNVCIGGLIALIGAQGNNTQGGAA